VGMIDHMKTWIKGSKQTPKPKPKETLFDKELEESLLKARLTRERIEELLVTRQSGNILGDTWGKRE